MLQHTIADSINANLLANVVGRDEDLATLTATAESDAPLVHFVHGVSGIGKTTLLRALSATLARRGIRCVFVDGRDVEPTPRGVVSALAQDLAVETANLDSVVAALGRAGRRTVLIIDSYDMLGLIDTWLRRTLVPALPGEVRLVIGTRLTPGPQWTEAIEWRGLVDALPLGPLPDDAARELLHRLNVPARDAEEIVAMAGGLPVALTLAGGAADSAGPVPDTGPSTERMLGELARRFLDGIEEPLVREAVQAGSVVRRLTGPLLDALVPDGDPDVLLPRLRALTFCSMESDGLRLHDAVRTAVAADLRAADPERHRRYRQAAWRQLDAELRKAGRDDLWRYTADLIYLISNPVWRDAFFPAGSATLTVEPARPSHTGAIRELAQRYESPAAAELVDLWLSQAFHAFHVVRDGAGEIVGFYCLCDAARVPPRLAVEDPVTAAWLADLAERPLKRPETALFLRRWLSADAGEAPSPPQAASWLDIKRTYLERRPSLRRVYLALEEFAPYEHAATTLGFEPLAGPPVTLGNTAVQSAVLDMGPQSVDGWLSDLVAAELGLKPDSVLDRSRRGLRLDDRFMPLTPREFDVMVYIEEREGAVVTREDLLNDVWRRPYDCGSNVVDAVITSLRRKLGARAAMIETVRGHGYIYRGASGGS